MNLSAFDYPMVSVPILALLLITSLGLLMGRDWRWMILGLALQYAGVFVLVTLVWPLPISVVKLVAGWMAGAILGLAISNTPESWQQEERFAPSGRLFRLLAAGLVTIIVASTTPAMAAWLPAVSLEHVLASLLLIGLGLLHLGLTSQPLRAVMGLMTMLSGFEILYATIASSTLVAALLAGVNIGLALTGAYLLVAPTMDKIE